MRNFDFGEKRSIVGKLMGEKVVQYFHTLIQRVFPGLFHRLGYAPMDVADDLEASLEDLEDSIFEDLDANTSEVADSEWCYYWCWPTPVTS